MRALGNILKRLAGLGISLTESQVELLKWRLSDDAKEYYTRQENRTFYKELKKGNLKIVDAIRKEKQRKIEKLKGSLASILILVYGLFLVGCVGGLPKNIDKSYDSGSLKSSDKTYEFKNQSVRLSGSIKSTRFDGEWVIVNKDFIKTFNENQDTLIDSLQKQKKLKSQLGIYKMISMASAGGLFVLLVVFKVLAGRRTIIKT
jgi:hypothetical protein